MHNLQDLLVILDGQKLSSGSLASAGTAHDTVRALKNGFDPFTLRANPLPGMTNQVGAPNVLFSPARVRSIGIGQDAIFLNGVDGNAIATPAYYFTEPV
jgi:hypothetical protein